MQLKTYFFVSSQEWLVVGQQQKVLVGSLTEQNIYCISFYLIQSKLTFYQDQLIYVTVHEKTMHNALDINLRYRPK